MTNSENPTTTKAQHYDYGAMALRRLSLLSYPKWQQKTSHVLWKPDVLPPRATPSPVRPPQTCSSAPRGGAALVAQRHIGGTAGCCPSSASWLYHSHSSFKIQLKCQTFVSSSNVKSLPVTASVKELRESTKKFRGPSGVNLNCQRSV